MSNLSTTDTATHFYGVIYSDVTDKKETREMAVRTIFKKGTYRYTENSTMEAEFLDINSGRVYIPKGGNTAATLSRG